MGKDTQSNKDINVILEIQRMKLFLTKNIYAFTLGRGVGNRKGTSEKWDLRPGTFGGTRDPRPGTNIISGSRDPRPGTHLIDGIQNPRYIIS